MILPINVIDQNVKQLIPEGTTLPKPLQVAYQTFHYIHGYWEWWRRGQVYLNKNNFSLLTGGHLFNWAIGDNRFVRLGAQWILIANRTIECVKRTQNLCKVYRKFWDAINFRYPLTTIHPWKTSSVRWPSPSTNYYLYTKLYAFEYYLRNICWRSAKLATAIFNLSMATYSASHAFYLDPEEKSQAVNEMFVNMSRCLDEISENRQELIKKLSKRKKVIDGIFSSVHVPFTAEEFIKKIDKGIGFVQPIKEGFDAVKKAGVQVVDKFVEYAVGTAKLIGCDNYLPLQVILSGQSDQKRDEKIFGRYAEAYQKAKELPPLQHYEPKRKDPKIKTLEELLEEPDN